MSNFRTNKNKVACLESRFNFLLCGDLFREKFYFTCYHVKILMANFVEMVSPNFSFLQLNIGKMEIRILSISKHREFTIWRQQPCADFWTSRGLLRLQ